MRPKIGREEVIFSRHPQKTTFPPLYGLFENGIIAPRRGLGVHPVMFRGDVQRTGVEMLADLSPAPAAKYANQAANFGAAPSGGSGAAGARAGGIAFGGTSRISFANIFSHQRSSHISDLPHVVTLSVHKVQRAGLRGTKRLHALACNATNAERAGCPPPVGTIGRRAAHRGP